MTVPYNRVKFTSSTSGTGSFGVGTAVTGFSTPADRSIPDGTLVSYTAESASRTQWETGHGTYSSGSVSRATIYENSDATTSAVDFSAAPTVWVDLLAQDIRYRLEADTTFYVHPNTGSDTTGDGTQTSPWQTVLKAYRYLWESVDIAGNTVTIQILDDGSSITATGVTISGTFVGGGVIRLQGKAGDAARVTLEGSLATFTPCFAVSVGQTTRLQVKDLTMTSTYFIVRLDAPCTFGFGDDGFNGDVVLGNCFANFFKITINGPQANFSDKSSTITVSGSCAGFIGITSGSVASTNGTITVSGTPAWSSAMVFATQASLVFMGSGAISGSATGKRFIVSNNAVVDVNGGGLNYFPGDVAGTTSGGGQYIA